MMIESLLLRELEQGYPVLLIAFALLITFGMAALITAAYIVRIAILVPVLARLGYVPLVTHMFVFL